MVAALFHVGILGAVELHSPLLTLVRLGEAGGVSVPAVAIKLDYQPQRRGECVNAELACDKVLRQVGNAEFVEQRVADNLWYSAFALLLLEVHPDQLFASGGVRVAASERAVSDVVGLLSRGRPAECFTADGTNMGSFVPGVPPGETGPVTEYWLVEVCPAPWDVDRHAARGTVDSPPRLSHRAGAVSVTRKRAVSLSGWHVSGNDLPTSYAGDGSDLVA